MVESQSFFFLALFFVQTIILFALIYFLVYSIKSIIQVPKIQYLWPSKKIHFPMVSIILPARNEGSHIGKCLHSLIKQEYPNFEIIAINDHSTDNTAEIMKNYSALDKRIKYIDAEAKPEAWTGKNWACYQGYLMSKGEILLFTDADTTHFNTTISLTTSYLLEENLDALTAIPKIQAYDFLTKVTLPILWTLSLARFSALKANDPKSRVGYFFGSFFIITKRAYEKVGTHKSVKEEIIEDGELGRKVKEIGLHLKVIQGGKYISAVWARDRSSLWHGLRRLMVPLYQREKIKSVLMMMSIFLLLLLPLIIFSYSVTKLTIYSGQDITNNNTNEYQFNLLLVSLSSIAIFLLISTSILQLKYMVFKSPLYSIFFPLAGSLIFTAFLSSILCSQKENTIQWRDRRYTIKGTK